MYFTGRLVQTSESQSCGWCASELAYSRRAMQCGGVVGGKSGRQMAGIFRSNVVICGLWLLGIVHRLAFRLDEWLFPGLSETVIERPLFVVGLPRSGTTLMHRLLASPGGEFTTPPLWEVALAPALCEKLFFYRLYRLDRWLGGIGYRLVCWLESWGEQAGSSIHPTSLQTPEEDFLMLLPFGGCFLMVLAWPENERIWQLGYFAGHLPHTERQRLMGIYRGLIARHLRFRGLGKHYLSKNPSFTGWVSDLREAFPEARVIGLRRKPQTVVASQLSSLRDGLKLFGNRLNPELNSRFVKMLAWYWHLLLGYRESVAQNRFQLVEYSSLTGDSLNCVIQVLESLEYPLAATYRASLADACRRSAVYKSRHSYSLDEHGLDESQVEAEFSRQPIILRY